VDLEVVWKTVCEDLPVSGRLQTVTRDTNPRYYALIEAFRELTGVPTVLNTSFDENEPVVCKPEEVSARKQFVQRTDSGGDALRAEANWRGGTDAAEAMA